MRALAAGGVYVSVLFALGFVLGPIRVFLLEPRIGPLYAVLIEAPVLVLAMLLVAPRAASWMSLPRRPLQHLAMGLVAAAWMLAFELVGAWALRGASPAAYLRGQLTPAGIIGLALIAVLALVPLLRRADPPARG